MISLAIKVYHAPKVGTMTAMQSGNPRLHSGLLTCDQTGSVADAENTKRGFERISQLSGRRPPRGVMNPQTWTEGCRDWVLRTETCCKSDDD